MVHAIKKQKDSLRVGFDPIEKHSSIGSFPQARVKIKYI